MGRFGHSQILHFSTVRDRAGAFCREQVAGDAEAAGEVKIGKEAIQIKLQKAETKKGSTPLNFNDIAPFRVFHWLLEPAEPVKVDGWVV